MHNVNVLKNQLYCVYLQILDNSNKTLTLFVRILEMKKKKNPEDTLYYIQHGERQSEYLDICRIRGIYSRYSYP